MRGVGEIGVAEQTSVEASKMEDARDARRKRLAERKTDRLAFITGQSRSPTLSSPQDVTSRENITLSEMPKHYHDEEEIVVNELDDRNKQEPALKRDTSQFHNHEIVSEISQVASSVRNRTTKEDVSGKLFTTSMLLRPSGQDGPRATNGAPISILFTHRDIEHSVLATENLRLIITLLVAILVVSSYKGLIIGRTLLSSIISFRPLLSVLLTDVTIILGSVSLNHGINGRQVKDARKAMEMDEGWPNDLSRIFEIGQMLYKVLGAAFMDCCICAVILICGILV